MKQLFDDLSYKSSKLVTNTYSTSFALAVSMLAPSIRKDIHSIYGFVRFADEIVDSFHGYDKKLLLSQFELEYYNGMTNGISLNPIINSFQHTVKKYNIDDELVNAFLTSMRMDLHKTEYATTDEYKAYIYGSADVVGLMCLKVFVNGNEEKYKELKDAAMRLGSAFQKINFLRDLKQDVDELSRAYFPGVNLKSLTQENKLQIINEIKTDFEAAYKGIVKLPAEARFGVYTAFIYYKKLLLKLEQTHHSEIIKKRIRVSNPVKLGLLAQSFVRLKLNLL